MSSSVANFISVPSPTPIDASHFVGPTATDAPLLDITSYPHLSVDTCSVVSPAAADTSLLDSPSIVPSTSVDTCTLAGPTANDTQLLDGSSTHAVDTCRLAGPTAADASLLDSPSSFPSTSVDTCTLAGPTANDTQLLDGSSTRAVSTSTAHSVDTSATSWPQAAFLFDVVTALHPEASRLEFDNVLHRVATDAQLGMSDTDAIRWGDEYFSSLANTDEFSALNDAADLDSASLDLSSADPIAVIAAARMAAVAPNRLSSARVRAVTAPLRDHIRRFGLPDDSSFALPIDWDQFLRDIDLASDFGDNGVPIHTDPSFCLSSATGPCPKRYGLVHSAINAHVLKNRQSAFCVLLHRSSLDSAPRHVMNLGLAPKYGKAQGRLTSDASGVADPSGRRRRRTKTRGPTPLNTKWVAEEASRLYGEIRHPSLRDIIRTILRLAAIHGWDVLVIFKDDLKGFYQQCSFRPSHAHKMVFQVFHPLRQLCSPLWLMVSLAGNFGWSALPMVMEVITRLLRACIGWLIFGFMLMYVDDIIVITTMSALDRDRYLVLKTITDLLGPDAHAPEKYECTFVADNPNAPRAIDILGWSIDLSTRRVSVAYKNQIRALHWFLEADVDSPMCLQEKERLCSLAERYSAVFPELRILMPALYSMLGGKARMSRGTLIRIPARARLAILLWRAYLIASEIDRDRCLPLGRPLIAFGTRPPRCLVEFDGSLDGLGWRIYDTVSETWVTAAYMVTPPGHIPARDSTYQNTMELTALSLGLFHAVLLGWGHSMIHIRGDSVSTLSWVTSLNFTSQLAMNASALFVAVCTYGDIHIGDDTYITTDENFVCDKLSRCDPEAAARAGPCGPPGFLPPNVSAVDPFDTLLSMASPSAPLSTPAHFLDLWSNLRRVVVSASVISGQKT